MVLQKIVSFFLVSIPLSFFTACSSESVGEKQARSLIQKVSVKNFQNIHWKKGVLKEQFWYQVCQGGTVQDLIDFSEGVSTQAVQGQNADSLYQSIRKKIQDLKSYKVIEINGTKHCGESVLFLFQNGDYLVRSKRNLDNVIGFQHSRKVLQGEWNYYKKR